MQNLTLKIPLRGCSDKAVFELDFRTGESLISHLFPHLVPKHGSNGSAYELDMNVPDALIIEAVTDDGRSVTIEIPFSDSDKARVTVR